MKKSQYHRCSNRFCPTGSYVIIKGAQCKACTRWQELYGVLRTAEGLARSRARRTKNTTIQKPVEFLAPLVGQYMSNKQMEKLKEISPSVYSYMRRRRAQYPKSLLMRIEGRESVS